MTTTITSAEQWLRDSIVHQLSADPSFDAWASGSAILKRRRRVMCAAPGALALHAFRRWGPP